ncbi:MAG: Biotin transporter BioY [Chlamydiae bacterium]|nr:Biotin transporter BioY [Chlamydiota bacterium]
MSHALSYPSESKGVSLLKDVLIVLGASLLIGLAARIVIPLPFTPVPIIFSVQAVIFFSVYLGKRGFLATLAYLAQGAMGAPVFAGGGSGIPYLLGPTGGYLVGFAVLSFTIALFSEQLKEKTPLKIFAIMLLGNALDYVFGVPHLALFVGAKKALMMGCYPFVVGDLFKLGIVFYTLRKLNYFR